MRERAKHASYSQQHNSENSRVPAGVPKRIDHGGVVPVSRVRAGAASKLVKKPAAAANSGSDGGKMIQYKNIDDIPDGHLDSPTSKKETSRDNNDSYYDEEDNIEDDGSYEEYEPAHIAEYHNKYKSNDSYPMKPPSLPAEDRNIRSYGQHNPNSHDNYPPLRTGSETKQQPMVYPKSYGSSSPKFQNDDEDWDDDNSEEDDLPSYQSKNRQSSNYDEVEVIPKRQSTSIAQNHDRNKSVIHSSSAANRSKKFNPSSSQSRPPELPYEVRGQSNKKVEQNGGDKILSEKEQLYFSKQPRQIDYMPCTLGQYKQSNPKEYVESVPHIKPDLNTDVLIAKRANAERIKDFSRQLNSFNRLNLQEQKRSLYSSEASGVQITKKKLESNRERGMQFAKQINKPKLKNEKPIDSIGIENEDEDMYDDSYMRAPNEFGMSYEKESKLQELQAKHLDSRKNIAAIKKSMGV